MKKPGLSDDGEVHSTFTLSIVARRKDTRYCVHLHSVLRYCTDTQTHTGSKLGLPVLQYPQKIVILCGRNPHLILALRQAVSKEEPAGRAIKLCRYAGLRQELDAAGRRLQRSDGEALQLAKPGAPRPLMPAQLAA